MKQNIKKYKEVIAESTIGYFLSNIIAWKIYNNICLAFLLQFVLPFGGDRILRKQLVLSKRKKAFNILIGILKSEALLLAQLQYPYLSLVMIIMGIVSTRIMFYNDLDRTVQTVDELKEAYFVPTIVKVYKDLKFRASYVLSH